MACKTRGILLGLATTTAINYAAQAVKDEWIDGDN